MPTRFVGIEIGDQKREPTNQLPPVTTQRHIYTGTVARTTSRPDVSPEGKTRAIASSSEYSNAK
ncbi:hypothetical protein BH24CHL1_BH24CHL1_06450 [soil metagenome]